MKQNVASRSALRRFQFEAQILDRLRHPNIAQIHHAGMHDDSSGSVPYFAMEYIPGAKPRSVAPVSTRCHKPARWWAAVGVGTIVSLPFAWLLSHAALLPFFLGLFFFALFGLLIGAVIHRVASPGRPYGRTTVDSKEEIEERSELNNTAEVELSPPPTGLDEFQLYDGDGQLVSIGLPATMVASDMGVLTPIPAVALTLDCNDQTIGPFPIRDGDPNDGDNDTDLKIDFSYIYEGLGFTVAYPIVETAFQDDPGILDISLASGTSEFQYDVYDATGTTLVSTETVLLDIDNVAPSGLIIDGDGTIPTLVSDFNLNWNCPDPCKDITGRVPDADEIMCSVHSIKRSIKRIFGPYTLDQNDGGEFSFDKLSLLPGDNEIEVIAFDLPGNRQTWSHFVEMDLRYDPTDVTVGPENLIRAGNRGFGHRSVHLQLTFPPPLLRS